MVLVFVWSPVPYSAQPPRALLGVKVWHDGYKHVEPLALHLA